MSRSHSPRGPIRLIVVAEMKESVQKALERNFLSQANRAARLLVGAWMDALGMEVTHAVDGTVRGIFASQNPEEEPLLLGPHLDPVIDAIALVTAAKKQGVDVSVATCPHYLLLDAGAACEIGVAAKCAPPLRRAEVVSGLWDCLLAGEVGTLGSDPSPSSPELKVGGDIFEI